ncbi:MAG: NADH-quinone oxidoreductase subunit A [Actinomycetota bacterium]
MNPYVPIIGMFALAAVFAVVTLVTSRLVGPRRFNRAKQDPYECGIQPTPEPPGGGRFPVKYYLTAMTFIIFDIEIIFLYPWAVRFDHLGLFGFVAMVTFLVLITVPFVYEWRRGGLEWD